MNSNLRENLVPFSIVAGLFAISTLLPVAAATVVGVVAGAAVVAGIGVVGYNAYKQLADTNDTNQTKG